MAPVKIVFFQKGRGTAPALDFIREQSARKKDKILAKIGHLRQRGHELDAPHCRHLGEKIYELRARSGNVRLRLLYFFHDRTTAVLSHGIAKKTEKVPPKEIERAREHRDLFEADPAQHTHTLELGGHQQ